MNGQIKGITLGKPRGIKAAIPFVAPCRPVGLYHILE